MAQIGNFGVDAEPSQDFSPIPVGEYVVQIVDSDTKPTKRGDGHRLEMTFEVTDGQYKGRKVWQGYNVDNPNPKAVEIAQREIRSIREATGQLGAMDSQEFHYKPMLVRVDIEESAGYSPKNVIKSYKALAGAAGNAPTQPTAAATPASPSSPPWAQRNAA